MEKNRKIKTWKWIYQRSKSQLSSMILLLISNGVLAVSSVSMALICKQIVDSAVASNAGELKGNIVLLAGVILLWLFAWILGRWTEDRMGVRLTISYQRHMLESILKKEYKEVSAYHSGELLNRMFSDVSVVSSGVTTILPGCVNMLTRLVCSVGVLIVMDPNFTIIFLVGGVGIFLISRLLREKLKQLHKQVQNEEGRVRSFLQESIGSLLVLKVFGAEQQTCQSAEERMQDYYLQSMKRRRFSLISNGGLTFIFRVGYIYAISWGAFGILNGTISYGSLTAILQLVSQVQTPFANLSGSVSRIYTMLASAERLIEIEELQDERTDGAKEGIGVYEDLDRIVFDQVDFAYQQVPVLKQVDFSIKKGDFVSITGLSGGGKSTLFLLLLGAYSPNQGSIYLEDKQGVRYRAGKETRPFFAYVPQGNYLFSGTIRENLSFLKKDSTEEELWEAVETACADTFIRELPQGLDTLIGEKGFGLSEGQIQRIAVARAIVSGAPILLLDEATSALDEQTEAGLLGRLAQKTDKTCLIVTHRRAAKAICNSHLIIEEQEVSYERK